jgi:hypothetical protein
MKKVTYTFVNFGINHQIAIYLDSNDKYRDLVILLAVERKKNIPVIIEQT